MKGLLRNSILPEKAVSLSNLSLGKVTLRRFEKGTTNFLHEKVVTLLCNALHTLSTGHTGLTNVKIDTVAQIHTGVVFSVYTIHPYSPSVVYLSVAQLYGLPVRVSPIPTRSLSWRTFQRTSPARPTPSGSWRLLATSRNRRRRSPR